MLDAETVQTIERINKKIIDRLVDAKCKKCGKTIQIIPQEEEELCEDCYRKQEEYKKRLLKLDYILPLGYRHMRFDNFQLRSDVKNITAALEAAKRFVVDNTGVYLWGAAGQGKTHLLVATLRECVLKGKYVKLLKYSTELKNYKEQRLRKEDFIEEYSKSDFLFIDDFGSVGSKDDAIDILYGILQRRIENKKGKKIFITANMPIVQIDDDRVRSRIIGMCVDYKCHESSDTDTERYKNIIELKGNDIRLKGKV